MGNMATGIWGKLLIATGLAVSAEQAAANPQQNAAQLPPASAPNRANADSNPLIGSMLEGDDPSKVLAHITETVAKDMGINPVSHPIITVISHDKSVAAQMQII